MARTPAQRGKTGNWLVESRMARGWDTQEKARDEIERLTGWRIPQSVYAEWESGRRLPSDVNLERLRDFYGHEETGPASVDGAGLAQAISALVEELGSWRRGRENLEARMRALEAEVQSLRAAPADATSQERSAPRVTTG